MQSSAACIGVAVDLANLLDDATRTECDGTWWYTTFCEQILGSYNFEILTPEKTSVRQHWC